jgi:threonine dehydrogenase-like Zn-dependent dehydrogenase
MSISMLIGWMFLPKREKYPLPPRLITEQLSERVDMEAHKTGLEGVYDFAKQTVRIESDRPYVLSECIQACRKGGAVSLAGVYGCLIDAVPMGAAFSKGLTLKMGQAHVHRYLKPLFEK